MRIDYSIRSNLALLIRRGKMISYFNGFANSNFNFWIILVPAAFTLAGVLGHKRSLVKNGKLRKKFKQRFANIVFTTLTIVFMVLLVKESRYGILQWMYDNILSPQDSQSWPIILFFPAVFVCGIIFFILCITILDFFDKKHSRKLLRESRKKRLQNK